MLEPKKGKSASSAKTADKSKAKTEDKKKKS